MTTTPPLTLRVNGQDVTVHVTPDTPLLWTLRDHLQRTDVKFGCGLAQCGACTVHLNGTAIRACVTPVAAAVGQEVTTLRGLMKDGARHPVQTAWLTHQVPQCGYCQPGQMMSAAALLKQTPNPSDAEIDAAMSGNICRCGTYPRIRAAIKSLAANPAAPTPGSKDKP